MSKGCDSRYCHHDKRRRLFRGIFAGIVAFIILILFIIFSIWIILTPTKPSFILQDATLDAFNLSFSEPCSSPCPALTTLSLTMQVSLSVHNPNDRIGVYYQNLDAYVAYRGQQVSLPAALAPTYQGHNDFNVWSPCLYGSAVPVPPYAADALREDLNAGAVLLNVKVKGRVKWKVGTWISGRYHIYVNCRAYYKLACDYQNSTGIGVGVVASAVKLQPLQTCAVDV